MVIFSSYSTMRPQLRTIAWVLVVLACLWCVGFSLGPPLESAVSGTRFSSMAYQDICHQDPARSFAWLGASWAVCHRCSAIYIGFAVTVLVLTVRNRLSMSSLPRPGSIALLLAPVVADGLADMAGIWSATMGSRLLTGALTGSVLALIVLPVFADAVHKLTSPLPSSSTGGTNA